MADIANVNAVFTAQTSQFIASVKNATGAVQNFSDAAGKGANDVSRSLNAMNRTATSKLGSLARMFGVVAVGAVGAYAVKLGKDAVQSATAAGVAQDRLRRLLLTTGGATEEQIAILNQHARALEATTVVTAENVTTVQSQLATFDLHGSTIARLTPAILDYVVAEKGATASASDFRSMTNGLAQALNGQFAALTRVGFVLDEETKKMIKSGTESERSAAIVKVLNSTYKDFAVTAGQTAAGAQINLAKAIGQVKTELGNALLPIIQTVQSAISAKLVPALQDLQERFANRSAIERYFNILKSLGKDLVDFGVAIFNTFKPVFQDLLIPGLKIVIGAFVGFIKVLGIVGRFIQKYPEVFQVLIGVLASVTAGVLAYRTSLMLTTKAKVILTTATGKLKTVMQLLNTTMKKNPILFIVSAVIALGTGFVMLWKRSETFRKAVIAVGKVALTAFASILRAIGPVAEGIVRLTTGPMRGLLEVLSHLPGVGKYARAALDFINTGIDNISVWADKGATAIENFAKDLDRFNKVKVKDPFDEERRAGRQRTEDLFPDLSKLGEAWNLGAAGLEEDTKKGARKVQGSLDRMRQLIQDFADFMKYDFGKGLISGADSARDAINKSLDLLQNIFEEKAKGLSGKALKNLQNQFNQINDSVRGFIPQSEMLASELESLEQRLSEAENDLERALETRAGAVDKFNELFREPFGEPSQLKRSLSSAEATVDSIISMYDNLVETINQRFTGIDPAARDQLINFLTNQTASLVALARRRVEAVKVLEQAQSDLDDLLSQQRTFQSDLSTGLRNFATAIADLSKADSSSTLQVIKTATGLVITQLQSSSNGVDKITKQLQDRLRTIRDFSNNIRALLSSGLDERYIKQLLEAGPDAAALTAAALATASSDQINEINSLYSDINSLSENFGREMSNTFYQNAVDMATAFRDGAQAEISAITAQMDAIRVSIEQALAPLRDAGANIGNDMMQALVNAIRARRDEVLAEIQALAAEIARLLAAAAGAIGIKVPGGGTKVPTGGGIKPELYTDIGVPKSQIEAELKAATIKLNQMLDKLAKGGLGKGALENLRNNIKTQEMLIKDLNKELKSATKNISKVADDMLYQVDSSNTLISELVNLENLAGKKGFFGYGSAAIGGFMTAQEMFAKGLGSFTYNQLDDLYRQGKPLPIAPAGSTSSASPSVTNVNSGAVQITVTNNAGTGAIEAIDIEAAVTSGMLAALDGRRMVAQ